MVERVDVQIARQVRRFEQRLDLRAEKEAAVDHGIVQRLDADAVARDQERARTHVPDREAKHPSQPPDRRHAPLFVRVNDRLRVSRRIEPVSCLLELVPKFTEVVNLAVEHNPNRTVLVVDRLVPGRQVDDAQPAHAEGHALVHQQPFVVGPAVANHLAHPMREISGFLRGERGSCRWRLDESGNATHKVFFSCVGSW